MRIHLIIRKMSGIVGVGDTKAHGHALDQDQGHGTDIMQIEDINQNQDIGNVQDPHQILIERIDIEAVDNQNVILSRLCVQCTNSIFLS